jgi:hypothetical protein
MPKKASSKVTVELSPELLAIVDEEVKRLKALGSKLRVTRPIAIQALVRRYTRNLQPAELSAAYDQYIKQSSALKLKGGNHLALGETGPARQAFLHAAAFELLALSVVPDPTDAAVIKHLVEVVELTKDGTGYKSLPDAVRGSKLLATTGSA